MAKQHKKKMNRTEEKKPATGPQSKLKFKHKRTQAWVGLLLIAAGICVMVLGFHFLYK